MTGLLSSLFCPGHAVELDGISVALRRPKLDMLKRSQHYP